jgi:hypothetical protein
LLGIATVPAYAQPAAPATLGSVPEPIIINKLVWSAMAALDQANQTGNYSVLRDLGAPSFQSNNSAATLGAIFESLRAQQVDLGDTLIVMPSFEAPPAIVEGGLLRIRGTFPLRPMLGFDLLFEDVSGQWRIFGIAVVPLAFQPAPSGSTGR